MSSDPEDAEEDQEDLDESQSNMNSISNTLIKLLLKNVA